MDDAAKSKVVGKMGFAPMPGEKNKGQPELGNWLLAIPAGSKRAELAFQFIRWATEPTQMKVAALRGNPPTRRSVFQDPELVKKFRAYPVQLASLESAKPRPRTHLWNEIENAFGIYLSKANAGTMPPEQALKQANEEIKSILTSTKVHARGVFVESRSDWARSMRERQVWLWVAPALLVLMLLSIYPMFHALQMSVTSEEGGFTLTHFLRMSQDRFFGAALLNTVIYVGVALIVELALGLGLALLVDSLGFGRGFFRAAFLIPMILPPVVVAVIWRLIFNPQFGVLNGLLKSVGVDTTHLTWTSGKTIALASVIAVDVWEWTPFMFLLISAGLQSVPQDPIEAARVDGASSWRVFRDIVLPCLKPVLFLAVLLRAMDLVRIFDQIWILTQGGPGNSTETVSLYIYRTAFRFFNFGYAAAMSMLGLVLAMIFARSLIRWMRMGDAR
jgi:multiple sugar transport system permease protein